MKTPQTAINNNLDCPDFYFTYKNHRGFTLLEIVIAIAIFSLLALGANSLLTTVMRSNEISAQREAKFEQLQRAMLIIERDFLQIQARTPRTQGLENDLIIAGGEFEFESDAYGIGFVRAGWRNPQLRLKRSTLQNVAYRVQENRLERLHTNYVDAVLGTEPNIQVLLDNVSDFKIEVLSTIQTELEWSETIPSTELPMAIAVIITIDSFGIIRREFQIKV